MSARLCLLAALWLAACAPPAPSDPPAPPAAEAPEAPAPSSLEGRFSATSTTAMGITGDLTVETGRLSFGKGFLLNTEPGGPIGITTPISKDGPSLAQTLVAPTSLATELRRVTGLVRAADASVQPLCGEADPAYVVLAYDTPVSAVGMAVFAGEEPPGETASKSTLCGTFSYDR